MKNPTVESRMLSAQEKEQTFIYHSAFEIRFHFAYFILRSVLTFWPLVILTRGKSPGFLNISLHDFSMQEKCGGKFPLKADGKAKRRVWEKFWPWVVTFMKWARNGGGKWTVQRKLGEKFFAGVYVGNGFLSYFRRFYFAWDQLAAGRCSW